MSRTTIGLALLLAMMLGGCSGEPSGAEYYGPTSEGRRTTYDVKMLAPFVGDISGTAIFTIRGKESIAGIEYLKTVTTIEGIPGAVPETRYVRIGDDGIYSRMSTDPSSQEILDLPLPPAVGASWSATENDMQITSRIAAIEDLDTATRTYIACLKIVHNGRKGAASFESTSWHAPNIGLVLMTTTGSGGTMEIRLRE